MKEFSVGLSNCLKTADAECIERFLPNQMYFPDQARFGCAGSGTNKKKINAKEFGKCVLESKKKDDSCGSIDRTLGEVLRACFADPKAKRFPSGFYFQSPQGPVCHLNEEDGKILISSVGCGC